jgi:DNA-binding NarL/FixJ family response regulator
MGGGIAAVVGSEGGQGVVFARALAERGYAVTTLDWPPQDVIGAFDASGEGTIVVDGLLPGIALRTIADAVTTRPGIGVVAVGPTEPNIEVLIALASGISSYLPAGTKPGAVADAVDALNAGEVVLPRTVSLPLVARLYSQELGICVERVDGTRTALTQREWQVLVLARQAYTTAEIADRLVVSKATVRTHLAALARKLGVPGRAALARPLTSTAVERARPKTVAGHLKSA